MQPIVPPSPRYARPRRAVRRATELPCQAVSLAEFQLLGQRVLDVSPRGLLLSCGRPVQAGQSVLVSFRAPGPDGPWLDAEAEVARVVRGQRRGDRGYCAGLRFTYFERSAREELLTRLAGLPPPIPTRGGGLRQPLPTAAQPAVRVSAIVQVPDASEVIPLVRRIVRQPAAPAGVFH